MTTAQAAPSASFADFEHRAKAGERLNIVFFGGSLTWGAQASDPMTTSYRARMAEKFDAAYPQAHFKYWDAAIGGTNSCLGVFRLQRDVLSRHPDLVFLDFTVNDDPFTVPDDDLLASYESLVRRLVMAGVPVVQVMFAVKQDVMPNPRPRPRDALHQAIARAYNIGSGDVVALMRDAVRTGKFTPDELWSVPTDETHPGDKGYELYAQAAWNSYQEAVASRKVAHVPPAMLYADTYMHWARVPLSSLGPLPDGWEKGTPHHQGMAFDFYMSRWLDEVTIARNPKDSSRPPASFRVEFRGTTVLLFGEMTPDWGRFRITIDGDTANAKEYGAGATPLEGNIRYVENIAQCLAPGVGHTLEITPILQPGQELRLESLCVASGHAKLQAGATPVQPTMKGRGQEVNETQ